jgi:hypothetical protein
LDFSIGSAAEMVVVMVKKEDRKTFSLASWTLGEEGLRTPPGLLGSEDYEMEGSIGR